MARALFDWLAAEGADRWRDVPASVTSTGATATDGRRVRFVHNWSWDEARVPLPVAVRDVLAGEELAAGDELLLGPWDVRVLEEVPGQA